MSTSWAVYFCTIRIVTEWPSYSTIWTNLCPNGLPMHLILNIAKLYCSGTMQLFLQFQWNHLLHFSQVFAQRLSCTKMRLVSLQPYQSLHDHLVQCVVIPPQIWSEMADLSAAISASISVVVSVSTIHQISILLPQITRRRTHYHFRTGAGIIWRQVHSECVLFVVGASNTNLNPCVASWIDPRHSATEVILQ